jgi:hypothetical protein
MPTRKSRLTRSETEKYRDRLKVLGVLAESSEDLLSEPKRFILKQVDHEFARFYDLPSGEIAVVAPFEFWTLKSGVAVCHSELALEWESPELDLSDPECSFFYEDLLHPFASPTVLNRWLTDGLAPPRGRRLKGLIIAIGSGSVPAQYHDEMLVTTELSLTDDQGNNTQLYFGARVDRSFKRKHEWRKQQYRRGQPTMRGLYEGGEKPDLGGRASISPKEPCVPRANGAVRITDASLAEIPHIYRNTILRKSASRASKERKEVGWTKGVGVG